MAMRWWWGGGGLEGPYPRPSPNLSHLTPQEGFMTVDMTIPCDEGRRYRSIITYATAMMLAFPLGVPLTIGVLLWRRRHDIETRASPEGDETLASLSFLFRA